MCVMLVYSELVDLAEHVIQHQHIMVLIVTVILGILEIVIAVNHATLAVVNVLVLNQTNA